MAEVAKMFTPFLTVRPVKRAMAGLVPDRGRAGPMATRILGPAVGLVKFFTGAGMFYRLSWLA